MGSPVQRKKLPRRRFTSSHGEQAGVQLQTPLSAMFIVKTINSTAQSLDSPETNVTMNLSERSFPPKMSVLQESLASRGSENSYEQI